MIHFEIPKNQSSILKVIGVGGGGSNAVNYMHSLNLDGVDFVVCNTDSQALTQSPVPNKIQLGPHLTQGLGAGANPEIGAKAGEESVEDITKMLKVNTKMAFITAGMGGGTGTGGAPVVAKICRELGILTVGIVTTPFTYEGRKRMKQAQEGIDRMREHVDTILIISNDKLRQQFGNLPFTQAFAKADDVLATAAKCITDVITTSGRVNMDFADVTTVMKNGGVAILGDAAVAGDNRALMAVEQALSSPLLNDNDINGAKWVLLNVTSAPGEFEHTLDELEIIQAYVQQQAGDNCDIILGVGTDEALEDKIGVTVIATGFNHRDVKTEMPQDRNKVVLSLDGKAAAQPAAQKSEPTVVNPLQQPVMERPWTLRQTEPQATATQDPLAPRLTETGNTNTATPQTNPEHEAPRQFVPVESFIQPQVKQQPAPAPKEETRPNLMQAMMQEEQKPIPMNFGLKDMSQEEVEEKRQFEEQKKSLEERAERLRRLSTNFKANETADDMEHVPAYMRRNIQVNPDESPASAKDSYLSGYSVGVDSKNQTGARGAIQTINTFLDGRKPD